jgi:putative chitinase
MGGGMSVVTERDLARIVLFADAAAWVSVLNAAMSEFGITTPKRQAMFIAQAAHESAGFRYLEENLNYSAQRLLAVFPKYFTPELASVYAHKPESIANRIYADRMGNGGQHTGDGWRFRGRGLIQLTGRTNYRRAGRVLKLPLDTEPDRVLEPAIAARTAAWFFAAVADGLRWADAGDLVTCTRRINGALHGIESRRGYYRRACEVLGVDLG